MFIISDLLLYILHFVYIALLPYEYNIFAFLAQTALFTVARFRAYIHKVGLVIN